MAPGRLSKPVTLARRGAARLAGAVKALANVDPMTAATFALGFVAGEGENQDECQHCPQETTHGVVWNAKIHYESIGGQSCGYCRARVFMTGGRPGCQVGACSICLST